MALTANPRNLAGRSGYGLEITACVPLNNALGNKGGGGEAKGSDRKECRERDELCPFTNSVVSIARTALRSF